MHLRVNGRYITLGDDWVCPERIAKRARSASSWPKCAVYLEFGDHLLCEALQNEQELALACRLVHAHHYWQFRAHEQDALEGPIREPACLPSSS